MGEKYVVARKDICGGTLLKPFTNIKFQAYDLNGQELSLEYLEKQGISNIQVFGGLVCRGMLFSVNEKGLSNDLIYSSSNYPIEGIKPTESLESDFIIKNYVELNELLKYLNYSEYLNQKEVLKVYKTLIISNRWLNKHMELFGWIKDKNFFGTSYSSGGVETISHSIYNNLSNISCSRNGNPHREEPDFCKIKRRT